jgi:hypothetical protein
MFDDDDDDDSELLGSFTLDENGNVVENFDVDPDQLMEEGEPISVEMVSQLPSEEKEKLRKLLDYTIRNGVELDETALEVWQYLNAN